MQCDKDHIKFENFCKASAKKLGCSKHPQDNCKYEARGHFFNVNQDALCDAAKIMFETFGQKDTHVLSRSQFVDMSLHALYEIVFISFFNEPTENDYFSGHVIPEDPTAERPNSVNLLRNHP